MNYRTARFGGPFLFPGHPALATPLLNVPLYFPARCDDSQTPI